MSTKAIAILVVTSIIGLGAVLFIISSDSSSNSEEAGNQANSQSSQKDVQNEDSLEEASDAAKFYEKSEVALHNTERDCWTIISNSVYDITTYIARHSGGDEILRACGVDSTTMFESRETESGEEIGSGEPHSSNAERQLEQLKIGELAQ
jgi:cytochrome b involved in lipid metabolism